MAKAVNKQGLKNLAKQAASAATGVPVSKMKRGAKNSVGKKGSK